MSDGHWCQLGRARLVKNERNDWNCLNGLLNHWWMTKKWAQDNPLIFPSLPVDCWLLIVDCGLTPLGAGQRSGNHGTPGQCCKVANAACSPEEEGGKQAKAMTTMTTKTPVCWSVIDTLLLSFEFLRKEVKSICAENFLCWVCILQEISTKSYLLGWFLFPVHSKSPNPANFNHLTTWTKILVQFGLCVWYFLLIRALKVAEKQLSTHKVCTRLTFHPHSCGLEFYHSPLSKIFKHPYTRLISLRINSIRS